jgi:hypothetical protein
MRVPTTPRDLSGSSLPPLADKRKDNGSLAGKRNKENPLPTPQTCLQTHMCMCLGEGLRKNQHRLSHPCEAIPTSAYLGTRMTHSRHGLPGLCAINLPDIEADPGTPLTKACLLHVLWGLTGPGMMWGKGCSQWPPRAVLTS